MDLSHIKQGYELNQKLAHKLVEDIHRVHFAYSPGPGLENHPAWTIGHLVTASAQTAAYIGGVYDIPEGWEAVFSRTGPGDPRTPDRTTQYPPRDVLLAEYDRQHEQVVERMDLLTDEFLLEEAAWRFGPHMSNRLGVITFMCLMHEAMHLSQLSAWRRALGYDSALAKL